MRSPLLQLPARQRDHAPRPAASPNPTRIGVLQRAAGNAATAGWLRSQIVALAGSAPPSIQCKRKPSFVAKRFDQASLDKAYDDSLKKGRERYGLSSESKGEAKESKADTTKADVGKEAIFDKHYEYTPCSEGGFIVRYPKRVTEDFSRYIVSVDLQPKEGTPRMQVQGYRLGKLEKANARALALPEILSAMVVRAAVKAGKPPPQEVTVSYSQGVEASGGPALLAGFDAKGSAFDSYYSFSGLAKEEGRDEARFQAEYPVQSEYSGSVNSSGTIGVDVSYRYAPEIEAEKRKTAVNFSDILWILYRKAVSKGEAGTSVPQTIETHDVMNDLSQAVAYMALPGDTKLADGGSWTPAQEEALALLGTPNLASNVHLWKDYLHQSGIRIETVSIPANEELAVSDTANTSPAGKQWPRINNLNFSVKLAKPKA